MIFHKFRWCNMSSFFCILLVLFHVSLAYMSVDMTTAVYSCNLILSPRELDFHMLSSLMKTVAAFASYAFTSFPASPSFSVTLTRYVKWSTHSGSAWPMWIGWESDVWLVLITFVFSWLICSLCSARLVVISWHMWSSSAASAISFVKSRSVVLPSNAKPGWFMAFCMMKSM